MHCCPKCPSYLLIDHVIAPVLFSAMKLRICYYDTINTVFCNKQKHLLIHYCCLLPITEIIVNTSVSLWQLMGHFYLRACRFPCLCLGSMCKIQVLWHFMLCHWVNTCSSWCFAIAKTLHHIRMLVTTCPKYPTIILFYFFFQCHHTSLWTSWSSLLGMAGV